MMTSTENLNSGKDFSDEHNYDGITELNNPAPVWIMAIFFITIAFSVVYAVYYFGVPGRGVDQVSEYERKVAAFEESKASMNENNPEANAVAALSLDEIKAQGSKLFLEKGCIACHGMKGEGNAVGPNLTDNMWLNGCSEEDIIHIITEGKPEKGMTPYKAMMSPEQISTLSQYIEKVMVGSNPENAKAGQGVECE